MRGLRTSGCVTSTGVIGQLLPVEVTAQISRERSFAPPRRSSGGGRCTTSAPKRRSGQAVLAVSGTGRCRRDRCSGSSSRNRSRRTAGAVAQEPLPFGGQRPVARSPRVAPTTILPGHAHHQRNQFCTDARPTKSAPLNERPLLCYQLTVPARQRVGRKDRAKLVQRSASEGPRLLGKLPTLRVREDHALTPASLKVTPLR